MGGVVVHELLVKDGRDDFRRGSQLKRSRRKWGDLIRGDLFKSACILLFGFVFDALYMIKSNRRVNVWLTPWWWNALLERGADVVHSGGRIVVEREK